MNVNIAIQIETDDEVRKNTSYYEATDEDSVASALTSALLALQYDIPRMDQVVAQVVTNLQERLFETKVDYFPGYQDALWEFAESAQFIVDGWSEHDKKVYGEN